MENSNELYKGRGEEFFYRYNSCAFQIIKENYREQNLPEHSGVTNP